MSEYSEKLKDPRWQKLRLRILDSARWRCEDCNRPDKQLQIHHCAYIPKYEPWEYGIDLLMCLCDDCHQQRQSKEDAFRVALGRITRHLRPTELDSEVWRILEDLSARETQRLAEAFS